ncbi:MAG: hypothetical protein GY696_38735 [Gammaproteobacteria bacterium]|nr:hypothetical protein [Gammaproteobacteria bacterium]
MGICKGGGEGAQEDLKSTHTKIRRKGGMCKEEWGPPVQADPKLQSSDNQQKRSSSEKTKTQGRSTVKKIIFNLLMACSAMFGVKPGQASGYNVDFFDCQSPTRIDKFARPIACESFAADEQGPTFEVLTKAETSEVPGWSCEVIHSEWRYQCGLFSHLKLAGLPHFLRHSPVTVEGWSDA